MFQKVSATSLSELPSFKHVFNTAISFRAKDISPDLDVPFVCWRLWSGLVQLWRNSVRASAKPWLSWFCCLFSSAGCLGSSPTTQLSTIPTSCLSQQSCFTLVCFIVGPSRPFPKNYLHGASNMLIFIRTPPHEFLQRLFLPPRPFKSLFFDKPTRKHHRHLFFGFRSHLRTGCLSVHKHFLPFFRNVFFPQKLGGGRLLGERDQKEDQQPPKHPKNINHPRFNTGSSPRGHSHPKFFGKVPWKICIALRPHCSAFKRCRSSSSCVSPPAAHGVFQAQPSRGPLRGLVQTSPEIDLVVHRHEVQRRLKKLELQGKAKAQANTYNH